MSDPRDEISMWAERLTPEGSPGAMSEALRKWLGDSLYEKEMERQDTMTSYQLTRSRIVNQVLSSVLIYVHVFGVLSTVLLVTTILQIIF